MLSSDEELVEELLELRLDARALKRSGHPAVRAEGIRALDQIDKDLRMLRKRTANAQL